MDFVCKLYGNTYAVQVTVALVGVATLNLALPATPGGHFGKKQRPHRFTQGGDFCRQPGFTRSMYKFSKNVCLRKSPGDAWGVRLACNSLHI